MQEEIPETPIWDTAKTIQAYKGIRVDGTELKPVYGFRDYWAKLYCKPWFTQEAAQAAADKQKAIDEAPI